ncbi:hypothetical protein Tco_1121355 [Tanacetum coccineum]|uniref:Uncharacterized protein n=1 Tax=Tanacetum coccineum TaxID=301880 RepID=A0ABQ5IZ00_9ASTR
MNSPPLLNVLKLHNANAYHLKISNITPLPWRGHLDNQLDDELLDLHDRCYARQAVMDNVVNRRAQELLKVVEQMKEGCEVLKVKEKAKDKECDELKAKSETVMAHFNNNLVNVLRQKIVALSNEVKEHKAKSKVTTLEAEKERLEAVEAALSQEVDAVKGDRVEVVSKAVPYIAIELVHSDELGMLVGKLVSSTVFYGRFTAFEEVAEMK